MNLRSTLTVLAALATTSVALAEIKINDNLSTSGYVVGSYQYTDKNYDVETDRADLDTAKLGFAYNLKPVTGVVSLYYSPSGTDKIALLDAYATYDVGSGFSVTGGKFLSYLGYEAFDIPNMTQISYANGALGVIPGYHTGVKLDYSAETQAFGLAVIDSVFSGPNYLKGDGELKKNVGLEAYYSYKGIKDLTLWSGVAYESGSGPTNPKDDTVAVDFWASYQLNKETVIAGEYAIKEGAKTDSGYNWLALVGYTFTDTISGIARISGESVDYGTKYTKYTVCPTYTITGNLSVRAEYSYVDYSGGAKDNFFGVQAIFKF